MKELFKAFKEFTVLPRTKQDFDRLTILNSVAIIAIVILTLVL